MPDLTELGFGLGALALIWVVVQYFIKTLERKDTQISEVTKDFTKVIANHIVHETTAWNKTCKSLDNLNKSTKKLYQSQNPKILLDIKGGIEKLNKHQDYQEGKNRIVASKLEASVK